MTQTVSQNASAVYELKWKCSCEGAQSSASAPKSLHSLGSLLSADVSIFLFCECSLEMFRFLLSLFFTGGCVCNCVLDFVAAELINKLNFLEDEDQEAPPAMSTNPFDEPDDDVHANDLNPFGDPEDEGAGKGSSCKLECVSNVINRSSIHYNQNSPLSTKQSPLPSPFQGSTTTPLMITTLPILSMSLTNLRPNHLLGTPLTSTTRTWTSIQTRSPQNPGREKECGLLT